MFGGKGKYFYRNFIWYFIGIVGTCILVSITMPVLMLFLTPINQARQFCRLLIIRPMSRLALWGMGIDAKWPKLKDFPQKQVVYFFNHNSNIDLFILTGLGVPNARFFLSTVTKRFIPMTIINLFMGTFYIPFRDHNGRVAIFKKAADVLEKTGESVILSPEGVHRFTPEISKFNRGPAHLALAMQVPIVPIYIFIPDEINGWDKMEMRPGKIDIGLLPEIPTTAWKVETLDEHKEMVRQIYIEHHQKRHAKNTESTLGAPA